MDTNGGEFPHLRPTLKTTTPQLSTTPPLFFCSHNHKCIRPGVFFSSMALGSWAGSAALVLAILIFSSNNTAFEQLSRLDTELFIPCNVLCASNMVGLVILLLVHGRNLKCAQIKALTGKDWLWHSWLGALQCGRPLPLPDGTQRV